MKLRKCSGRSNRQMLVSALTGVFIVMAGIVGFTYPVDAEQKVYTNEYSDLVATVEDGGENDVYFANVQTPGSADSDTTIMFVNTEKEVTISMKEGKSVTTDCIYVVNPSQTNGVRHIILDNVSIDRSSEELFFQWVDLVNGLSDESRAMLSAIYFPGTTMINEYGGTIYSGKLRITLKGNNVLKGAKSSNADESYQELYTPSKDDNHSAIWAMNLGIDGTGSLEADGTDYGIYTKRVYSVNDGCIKASGSKKDIYCVSSEIRGGCYDQGSSADVYGFPAYAGTVNSGNINLYSVYSNTDESTKEAYPYRVRYTDEASDYLNTFIARDALSNLDNGEDYVNAYDSALAGLDSYYSGNSVSVNYGMNYGFSMSQSMAIVNALKNDHPEYWWLWINSTSAGPGGAAIQLENSYSYAKYLSNTEKFENAVSEVSDSSGVTKSMTDYQKAYVLYQALASHVSYDLSYIDQSANSAFVSGKAVCDGYAKAYIYLLRKQGIPASYVEGWGTPGGETGGMHGWVIVKLGDEYYYCDPTWDGMGSTATFNNYMLNSSEFEAKGHEVFADDMGYVLPASTGLSLGAPSDTVTITAGATEDATIYPNNIKVEKGSPFKIKVVPNEGKTVDSITVNDTPVTPEEDGDGSFSYIVQAASTDTVINVTCKAGSKASTKLSAVKTPLTFKMGDTVSGSVKLTDTSGIAVSGKEIRFSTVCISDENITIADMKGTTNESGVAAFTLNDVAVGEYRITAVFAGDDSYRTSEAVITITILTDTVYSAGDFVLSRTGGGTLTEGVDYSYAETEAVGSGVLSILSDTPMTISMSEDVSFSDDRIYVNASDKSVKISLTLSDVRINRSNVSVVGDKFTYDSETNTILQDESNNIFLSSAFSSKNNYQDINITLEGNNYLQGISYGENIKEYAAVNNGDYTFSGSGSLSLNEEVKLEDSVSGKYSVQSYGINCQNVTINSGNIVSNADGHPEMNTINGINVLNKYRQYGGNVSVSSGKNITDGYNLYNNAAIDCSTFIIDKGMLNAVNCESSSELAESKYANHACIHSFTSSITGGTIKAVGDTYGLYIGSGDTTVYVDKMELSGSVKPMAYILSTYSISGSVLIEGGLFNEGNIEEQTAFGFNLVEGSSVSEEIIDGVKWYRVKSSYQKGLEISGGVEGVDYEYGKGVVKLLTDTPLTFTMNKDVEAATDIIVSEGTDSVTYNITFNNVKFDRSKVTFDDVPTYKDDIILDIKNGNLKLNLVGNNYLQGSLERGVYDGKYISDNIGIMIEKGKLTIGGTGSLRIDEPYVSYGSAGIYAGEIVMNSGNVDVVTGGEGVGFYSVFANTYILGNEAGTGDITVNGGSLKATISGGDSRDDEYNKGAALCAYGKLTINDGTVTASMGDTAGSSYGVLTGGDFLMKKGSLTTTSGKAGIYSSGMECAGDFEIKGGEITSIGGSSGFTKYGYGIIVFGDLIASGGKISATGATGQYEASVGIYQASSTGFAKLCGAEIIAKGADNQSSSYGAMLNGHTLISAGKITAIGGKSETGDSVGLYNDTDSETVISGGELILSGSDAYNMSVGMFQSSISGGVDLTISGGTIQASGGKVTGSGDYAESSGIYIYNQLVITGGNIKAEGLNKPIDSNVASIKGGAFAVGDQNAGTVYGYKVADGYKVTDSSNAVYRYVVSSIASGGESGGNGGNSGSGGNSETGNTESGTGNGDNAGTGNADKGNGGDTSTDGSSGGTESSEKTPSVGTTESDTTGKATYKVAETTKDSNGNTVVEVTYVAPTAKEKKAASVTVPDTVTLEDGTKAQVTEIAANAFKKDTKLKKVTVGSNVETIGTNAFSGCSNLTTVKIKGKKLSKVSDGAFQNCKKLTKVNLGNNVTTVGKNAFSGDKKLKEVTLNGNKIKKVGKNAFKGIKKNAKIIIQAKDSKTYKKAVKMIQKSGAKNVKFKFKKKK